uniref:G-rich RNA sequence binding factor 1 n=1 Tax=Astyanax mexicanus TaxID=7994 RepID=A0A3B1K886_ASTMX
MSVSGRTALVKSLLRCCGQRGSAGFRRTPRAAVCGGEGLGPVKFTVRREKHTWVIQPALNPSTTLTWTLQRRSLSSETPYKEDEYPPLPEYTPPQETDTKEVFVIRVRGLPWSCVAEDVVKFFSECQIRGSVNGIHLMHDRNGKPNGEAFIELEDEVDLHKALERHMEYLGSRYIEGLDVAKEGVTFVLDHRGRKTGDAFVKFANQEIANRALQRDKDYIGKRYIEVFPSKNSEIHFIRRRKEASDTTLHTRRTNSVSVPIHHDNMRGLTNQATAGDIINAPSKEDEDPPSPVHTPPQETDTKEVFVVRVKGLPWSCLAEDLVKYFSECQIRGGVNGIHLMYNKIGKPNGEALIELEDEKDLSKAMERHGQYIGSRYIEVYKVTNQDVEAIMKGLDRSHSEDGVVCLRGLPFNCSEEDVLEFFSGLDVVKNGVTFVLDNRGRKSGNAYVQFANQETAIEALQRDKGYIGKRYIEVFLSKRSDIEYSRVSKEASDTTFHTQRINSVSEPIHHVNMRGLPYQATAGDIVNFFSPIRVLKVLIEYCPDGQPRGVAEVYFRSHQDALAAMSKDKECIDNKSIELFLNSQTAGGN